MILYCIRHGQTLFNAAGRIQGQSDTELSPLGLQQCDAVAKALVGRGVEVVYSSPLRRALEGARCIAEALEVELRVDPRLMEINAGIFQGLDWAEIDKLHPEHSKQWRSQDPEFRIPGGESRRELMHRAGEVFAAIRAAHHDAAIIVSHGGLLSAALKVLLEIPAQRNPFSLMNGSITKLSWDSEAKLLTYNDTAHLAGLEGNGGEL
jgi:broad specificity phosphatase PhoE